MRTRVLTGTGLLLLLTGCGADAAAVPPAQPRPMVTTWPAAVAGGACVLFDYTVIEQAVGTRFSIAAAMRHQKTDTCVVQAEGASRPDLVLSVTATSADPAVFNSELVPKGAATVKELGKAAYRVTSAPAGDDGAAAEVGWLTDDKRLFTLRYTLAAGGERGVADELAPKLVDLARQLDPSLLK